MYDHQGGLKGYAFITNELGWCDQGNNVPFPISKRDIDYGLDCLPLYYVKNIPVPTPGPASSSSKDGPPTPADVPSLADDPANARGPAHGKNIDPCANPGMGFANAGALKVSIEMVEDL